MTRPLASIHPRVGIGLRAPHIDELLAQRPPLGWLEVHSENWMTDAGPLAERLMAIRAAYPLSLHGVGLSLGSADGLDHGHLAKLKRLVERTQPILVSEHIGWGAYGGRHSNDLLPLPYNEATLQLLVERIDTVQQVLGRRLLVENLTSYCTFRESTLPEWLFVRDLVERADCGLLLDLNNVYVNAVNHGFDPTTYLDAMPWSRVAEVHLAGYDQDDGALIDTHGRPVQPPVWALYQEALDHLPPQARVLIEWDTDLPPLAVLLAEAAQASSLLENRNALA